MSEVMVSVQSPFRVEIESIALEWLLSALFGLV